MALCQGSNIITPHSGPLASLKERTTSYSPTGPHRLKFTVTTSTGCVSGTHCDMRKGEEKKHGEKEGRERRKEGKGEGRVGGKE